MGLSVRQIAAMGYVAQAITTVGYDAVKAILEEFADNKKPTMEELEALGDTMEKPENLFDETSEKPVPEAEVGYQAPSRKGPLGNQAPSKKTKF